MLQPGQILAGKYRIDHVIGSGGMGTVVAATHLMLAHRVAIKVLLPQLAMNQEAAARFVREAQYAARLTTEHIVRVLDVGVLDDGPPYLVMEHLEGHDLETALRASGPMAIEVAVDHALQILHAMAEAHRLGIIHRDLKPANCFLTRRADGRPLVKVLDFGIARGGLDDARLTHGAAIMGSPSYMSPEQMRSSRTADARSDIWSLGVILYELVSGRVPFVADSLSALAVRVLVDPVPPLPGPPDPVRDAFAGVIRRCLEKNPAARLQTVAALAAALAPFGPPGAREAAQQVARILGGSPPTGAADRSRTADPRSSTTCGGAAGAIERPRVGRWARRAIIVGATLGASALTTLAGVAVLLRIEGSEAVDPAQPGPLAATVRPDPALAKLRGYVGCINEFSAPALDSRAQYERAFNRRTGPTGSDAGSWVRSRIRDPVTCERAVAAGHPLPPDLPALDQAAAAYAGALRALFPVLEDAGEYYEQLLYKEDRLVKGKALHPRLIAAFDGVARADRELRAQLQRFGREVRTRELARLAALEGQSLRVRGETLLLRAGELIDLVRDKQDSVAEISTIDDAALTRALDAYQPTIAELGAGAARQFAGRDLAGAGVANLPLDDYQTKLATDDMIEAARTLVRRTKELRRHLRGEERYTEIERLNLRSGELTQGSPAGMIEAYNRLVQAADRRPGATGLLVHEN